MTRPFILIPGRSSKQGVTLNEGKYTDGYRREIASLRMNPTDMEELQLSEGDVVRVWNSIGEFFAPCTNAKDELPPGMLFIAYGDLSCRVMPADTHGSGMPDSKGLDVFAERSPAASQPSHEQGHEQPSTPAAEPRDAPAVSSSADHIATPQTEAPGDRSESAAGVAPPATTLETLRTPPSPESPAAAGPSAIAVVIMIAIGAVILVFAARAL